MSQYELSDPVPDRREDGSIDSTLLRSAHRLGRYHLIEFAIPAAALQGNPFGRFVMARCTRDQNAGQRTDWSVYLRRPLFLTAGRLLPGASDTLALQALLPNLDDAGYRLLSRMQEGTVLNLLGPFGRETTLQDSARQLLLIASGPCAPLVLPAAEEMLDRNGRVTIIVRESSVDRAFLSLLPISVEVQASADCDAWGVLVDNGLAWADSIIIADTALSPQAWADRIRTARMALDNGFAQILVPADLLCCTGVCMACVVPRANGSLTRACMHGPVFSLADLAE